MSVTAFPNTHDVFYTVQLQSTDIIKCSKPHFVLAYFDEQIPSKTELDQEQEHHASKQHFDDVSDTSYSCICSILDLQFMMRGSEIQAAQI